jgi:hypothetical protein
MSRNLLKIFLRFTLVYVVLVLPWPGFHQACNAYIRTFGSLVFAGQTERSEITFETTADSPHKNQMRAIIVNKALMNSDGSGPVRNLYIDAHAIGWMPIALLAALIYATPLSWGRRARAFVLGTVGIHLFLVLLLGAGIWREANEISLATLTPITPFWKSVAIEINAVLASEIGLCLPVLIWGLVTFRAGDRLGDLFHGLKTFPPVSHDASH